MQPADLYLDAQLETLERLTVAHPDRPEARTARHLVRRARLYQQRGLLQNAPRSRRYLLGDIRSATLRLERLSVGGRDPPP